MATGSEQTTSGNVKALWAHLWGGGTLRALRKAMGLGDTLGALPPENGGTGSTNAQGILEKAYPVGSVYMSLNSTNPETLFGGTWAPIRDRFLVGAGGSYAAKATGGEATHKLTADEMPSHQHSEGPTVSSDGDGATNWENSLMPYGYSTVDLSYFMGSLGTTGRISTYRPKTSNAGSGTPHNNIPPYYAVYMWARTA